MPILSDPRDSHIEALLVAAEEVTLNKLPVLQYLREIEEKRGENNLRGYSFWCVLVLLARHRPTFPPDTQNSLKRLADDLCQQACSVREKHFFFDVSGYLEALVVLRLVGQEDIAQDFEDAANEWIFFEWGSGAHLSSTRELLSLLGLILTLDPNPPHRTSYLFQRLVMTEESLAFTKSPIVGTLRQNLDKVQDILSRIFVQKGLRECLPEPLSPGTLLTVPCFGGAVFRRQQAQYGTLETLSHYPFAPSTPAHLLTLNTVVCKANDGQVGLFGDDELTVTRPPFQSVTLQQGGEALTLRFYDHPTSTPQEVRDGWTQFETGGIGVAAWCLSGHEVSQERRLGSYYLSTRLETPSLFVVLWAISLEGEIEGTPVITPARVIPSVPRRKGEEAWDIDWELPGGLWKVRVDPLAKEPLRKR